MKITGLIEALGIPESEADKLRDMKYEAAMRQLWFASTMTKLGKPFMHGVNRAATARRRAANRAARKARRVGR